MKPEHFKPIRKPKPKRRGKTGRFRSRTVAVAQEGKSIASPQLREAYSTKIEWARKLIPRFENETEAPEEK